MGPSNLLSGFASGAAALAAGVGVGAATFVAAPIMGAKQGGVLGGIAGLGAGGAGLAGGILAGAVGASASVVAGAVNTPGTIMAALEDDDLHGEETIDLTTVEVEDDEKFRERSTRMRDSIEADREADGSYAPRTDVKDRTLYDTLGVQPNATSSQLKRAYHKLAMREHPDKGGDTERFQKIGDAWQVLSDPAKREKYDEGGMEAIDTKLTDPGVVFAMMFGEEKFSHLCGDLTLVMTMRLDGLDAQGRAKTLEKLQAEREQRLAKLLALRLDTWLSDEAAFIADAQAEVEQLAKTNLGPQMLGAIGTVYELRGQRGIFAGAAVTAHTMTTQARALEGAVNLHSLQAKAEAGDPTAMQASLFSVMAMDIENTVGRAARLCLHDTAVTKDVRYRRADGLVVLGRVFQGTLPITPSN